METPISRRDLAITKREMERKRDKRRIYIESILRRNITRKYGSKIDFTLAAPLF